MRLLSDPFLWASVSLFGLILATAVVAAQAIRNSRLLGFVGVALFAIGRVVLTLPFCPNLALRTNLGT